MSITQRELMDRRLIKKSKIEEENSKKNRSKKGATQVNKHMEPMDFMNIN